MAGKLANNVVGSAAVEILPSFASFEGQFAAGLTSALAAPTLAAGQAFEKAGKYLLTRFTLPLAVATAANIGQFQALDREVRTTLTLFGTAGPLVQETFDEMTFGIRGVAREVGGLERDIADGLYQTISAGIPKKDAFDFLETAQTAAFADKTADLTTAVNGITTAVNAWQLEAGDAERVSDVFFATVAKGKTTFGELSQDIGRVAPLAANAGVSLEETSGIIGALTLQGLKTSEAISFMRAAITGLLRPSEEMNAIFEDIGFASAEMAVPVIGLQAAFQTVSDAVGGSTSKMQELIGSSEGVTAALGVTGDNADRFEGVMKAVENSTGATANAFDIMADSKGRAFGGLTESFDRLGNTLGALGSELFAPIARGLTPVVDAIADGFARVIPIVRALGGAVTGMMKAFDFPVIRETVAAVFGLVTATGALLGILGPLVFVLGKLLIVKGIAASFNVLRQVFQGMGAGVQAASRYMIKFGEANAAATGAMGKLSTKVGGAGKVLGSLNTRLAASALKLGIVGLAIGAAVVATAAYIKHVNSMKKSTDTTGEAVERLAESLGVTLGVMKQLSENKYEINIEFRQENAELIKAILQTKDELGDAAAEDIVLGIAWEFSERGATPEEVMGMVNQLNQAAGLNLDLGENFNFEGVGAGLGQFDARLRTAVATFGEFTNLGLESEVILSDAARAWAQTFQGADNMTEIERSFQALRDVEGQLGSNAEATNYFYDEILKAVDGGRELGFVTNDMFGSGASKDAETTISQLREVFNFDGLQSSQYEIARQTSATNSGLIEQYQLYTEARRQAMSLTEEQVSAQADLISRIPEAMEVGKQVIGDAFNEIRNQFLGQMPLLGVYSGAVKQTFAEWEAGQNQFQTDMEAISTLRSEHISKLPQEVQDAFNNASVDQQAWLTTLGGDELETAMSELTESFEVSAAAADTAFVGALDQIMVSANAAVAEQFNTMATEAEGYGGTVSENFNSALATGAGAWGATADSYINSLRAAMGVFIPGPTVGSPTFNGVPGGSTVVNINNAKTHTLNRDAQQAAAIIGGNLGG